MSSQPLAPTKASTMTTTTTNASTSSSASSPLSAEFLQDAIGKVSDEPGQSLQQLEAIRQAVSLAQLFSSNESWSDVATSSLKFLQLDHYQAMALANSVPSHPPERRLRQVRQAMALHVAFVERLLELQDVFENSSEQANVVVSEKVVRTWLERQQEQNNDNDDADAAASAKGPLRMPAAISRQDKIARFRQKQDLKRQLDHVQALQQRRSRLQLQPEDEMEGHDEESLERHVWKQRLAHLALESMEEIESFRQEVVMLQMALQRQRDALPAQPPPPPPPTRPLTLTHVTQNAVTGQLAFQQEVRSQVFRPHWNQPTMTLAQLGEEERAAAMARQAQASLLQEEGPPKRMAQLVQEGLEDEADLVDQATLADRKWDKFREANPRGSGNKRGDLGDRNF